MFYRKRFTGSIENASVTENTTIPFSLNQVKIYVNQTMVLTTAIAEVLAEVYNTTVIPVRNGAGLIMIRDTEDGREVDYRFVIAYTSQSVWSLYSAYSSALFTCSSGAAYQPFNGVNYDFYVTVKGDPKGCLDVYIGSYNTPSQTLYGFRLCKGKDLKNNEKVFFIGNVGVTNALYPRARTGELLDGIEGNTTVSVATALSSNTGLATFTSSNEYLPLIKTYTTDGMFTLDECYISHSLLSNNTFYYLNDDVYYKNNMYILIKCTTMINS